MLDYRAEPNDALISAINYERRPIVKLLLERGANNFGEVFERFDEYHKDIIKYVSELAGARIPRQDLLKLREKVLTWKDQSLIPIIDRLLL